VSAAAWFCLGLPLAGALAITLAGTRISRRVAGYISTLTTMGAFVAAIVVFAKLLGESPSQRSHDTTAWTWLSAGPYHFGLTLLNDPLSSMMMLIVTGVGSLIIAYSVGYMDGEDEERRFFGYMSLFVFSMLLLVQTANLLLLLAGWGMVGLSSYLLIGFHQDRPSAIAAAKKAFVMNAFGDATFAIALFLLIEHTGTLDFSGAFAGAPHGGTVATLIALGLLGGAVAKSAQIPLHTWLPDAMEGPTPVSALIHAATMVTAGVYLLVRTHVLFENAPHIQDLAAALGAATLLMAGLIALVQNDIKRVIAYSTMSQIGYMFLGAAGGAYANGMFHLMTHAFFKALLFLAGGIIIHALTGEQDIRRMGGLGRSMPHTRTAFLIGSLALVGIPPFAGFFSKDSIIAALLNRGTFGVVLAFCALIGTFLTGVYAFRLYFVVFHGEQSDFAREHLHKHHGKEAPFSMVWTVTALAVLSTIGGWIQFAPFWTPISDWLAPVAPPFAVASNRQELVASVCAVFFGAVGIYIAWSIYGAKTTVIAPVLRRLAPIAEQKFYWDEAYDWAFYKPAVLLTAALGRFVERPLIAGSIREVSLGFRFGSREASRIQNGLVRSYALALASGLAVLAVVFLWQR
jgi:NADH-quinone oxidoreductase subunit L